MGSDHPDGWEVTARLRDVRGTGGREGEGGGGGDGREEGDDVEGWGEEFDDGLGDGGGGSRGDGGGVVGEEGEGRIGEALLSMVNVPGSGKGGVAPDGSLLTLQAHVYAVDSGARGAVAAPVTVDLVGVGEGRLSSSLDGGVSADVGHHSTSTRKKEYHYTAAFQSVLRLLRGGRRQLAGDFHGRCSPVVELMDAEVQDEPESTQSVRNRRSRVTRGLPEWGIYARAESDGIPPNDPNASFLHALSRLQHFLFFCLCMVDLGLLFAHQYVDHYSSCSKKRGGPTSGGQDSIGDAIENYVFSGQSAGGYVAATYFVLLASSAIVAAVFSLHKRSPRLANIATVLNSLVLSSAAMTMTILCSWFHLAWFFCRCIVALWSHGLTSSISDTFFLVREPR